MSQTEESCGKDLAESAGIPEQFGVLFAHVAQNLRAHAAWVGTDTAEGKDEHDAMLEVARAYEAIRSQTDRTAALLRALARLPAAVHDPEKMDKAALSEWMRRKVEIQRSLAAALSEHAEQSQRALEALKG